ncbi:hypothetical protein VNO80_16970 [Phaseolus coccineus]|uniref:Uncharacterized protein n=1 Tax=Phaseolus coccineus TaxID=3886 RepID=A0AAN9MMQ7_PHACN
MAMIQFLCPSILFALTLLAQFSNGKSQSYLLEADSVEFTEDGLLADLMKYICRRLIASTTIRSENSKRRRLKKTAPSLVAWLSSHLALPENSRGQHLYWLLG